MFVTLGWLGGVVNSRYMMIIMFVVLFLIVLAISYGFIGSYGFDFILEIKKFSNPYYSIGIYLSKHYVDEDEYVDEVVIGMFFINIVLVFYKFDA